MATAKNKTKLKDLSISELIDFEKAAKLILQRYEKILRRYDGTIDENSEISPDFLHYNAIYELINTEIKQRIDNLE